MIINYIFVADLLVRARVVCTACWGLLQASRFSHLPPSEKGCQWDSAFWITKAYSVRCTPPWHSTFS